MDYLQLYVDQFRNRLIAILVANNIVLVMDWWLSSQIFKFTGFWLILAVMIGPIFCLIILPWISANYLTQPTRLLWQAILHISPTGDEQAAPARSTIPSFGKELIGTAVSQLHQLVTVADRVTSRLQKESVDVNNNPILNCLPLPVLAIDKNQIIIFANEAAKAYLELKPTDLIGKNIYGVLDMFFETNKTLDEWLNTVRSSSVTASHSWNHVRISIAQPKKTLQFDLAAYYTKASPAGYQHELLLTLFDHSERYDRNDNAEGFLAMAVHELRTPLTLMRGYLEALEEDLIDNLPSKDIKFLQRVEVSGKQLASLVNNILNAARITDDQFVVQLHEEQWPNIINSVVNDMRLQASIVGIEIETDIASNIPTVGIDRLSMYEVMSNLLDNAIKYSSESKKILIRSYITKDEHVETTVQDFGVGIPQNIIPHLFDKFYRNHQTRTHISGTGLGLYLSKLIVNAHGGNIWVQSKEGQSTTLGFTILTYKELAAKTNNQPRELTRNVSGWIKNHSLYRR